MATDPQLLVDVHEFVSLHRSHGEFHARAGDPAPSRYRLLVACPCGVTFERWVMPEDGAIDLALPARWN